MLPPPFCHARGDEQSRRRAQQAFDAILQVALDCGGTITGEHGVGRTKRSALPAQLGPDVMDVGRRVRGALDPLGILNPGVLW
jgi:glycolate oxidase